jgi:hypothetical protein
MNKFDIDLTIYFFEKGFEWQGKARQGVWAWASEQILSLF